MKYFLVEFYQYTNANAVETLHTISLQCGLKWSTKLKCFLVSSSLCKQMDNQNPEKTKRPEMIWNDLETLFEARFSQNSNKTIK